MTKKFFFWLIAIIAGIVLFLLIFAPPIIRKSAVKNSKEWFGRSISLEKLKVNYFTGTAKLIDFRMYEADDSTIFISFDTLIIDTEPYRYISNDVVIEQLYLKGLTTHVIMYDSTFNFDDLFAFHQSGDSTSVTDTIEATPLKFELSDFELNDAHFTLTDAVIDKEMELNNIDFFVPYLSWDQEHNSEAGLRFDFKNGGFFQSSIDVNPSGGDFVADIMLQKLDISGYADFFAKYIDVGDFEGRSSLAINLSGNMNDPGQIKLAGLLSLEDFKLTDHTGQKLAGVDQLKVVVKEADGAHKRLIMDSLVFLRPTLYFEMGDSTNNLTDYVDHLNESISEQENGNIAEASMELDTGQELFYALNTFIIEDGIVDIVDRRTGEPFTYYLSELQLTTDSITSNSTWIESQSNMLLNNRGKLVAQIGVNPSDPLNNLALDYTITDFMLSDLNIYSRHYMGFPILYGDMYYKAHTEIAEGQIASENKLIIHNVELGRKGGGLYDLPLKFALFLLKDKDGVITLDVPVSGNLKDPKVSLGKIVWNTFKNLIIKAAAAPVKLLSGLIGADPSEIEAIEYEFIDTVFTEKKQHQLDLLLQLEQQKPDLEIELIYLNDPQLERQEIAIAQVGKLFDNDNRNYKTNKAEFEEFVKNKIASDSISVTQACLQLVDSGTLDSVALEFGKKRIADLAGYLKLKNDSTEIIVVPFNKGAPKNVGSKPRFEVKYGMKEEKLP